MKRPKQHILETRSRKSFERFIPDTWVARELSSDYGLDYLIEIFKNNSSTGNLFFVQLKGTDAEIVDDTISYQLSIDNIDYWNTITNPVLLVFFSSTLDKFWGIWTNELKKTISLTKEEQRTSTIKLTRNNLLTPVFFDRLETFFDNRLPSKINVSYKGNLPETKLLHECLIKWLKYFFKDEVQFENHMLPNTCIVEYRINQPALLTISVTTYGNTNELQTVEFSGHENYLFLPDIEINKIPKALSECLLLFALLNCEKDIKNALKIIQATIVEYSGTYLPMESFLILTQTAIQYERISELKDLAQTLILSNRMDEFQYLNSSILILDKGKSFSSLYQDNLKFGIERTSDDHLKGVLSYNLANSFRSSGEIYLSSLNYQNARKYEPNYKEMYYWWFEYAGVLFLSGHSKIAEGFYLKSYDLDNQQNIPLIFGLIGDCKFFQGKFADSTEYFDRLIGNVEKPAGFADEFILKSIVARNLVASKLDKRTVDPALSLILTQKALEEKDDEYLEKAISTNPLNGLAWFNYSISLNLKGDTNSALMGFLTTACIEMWDSEAWKNSLLLAFTTQQFELFTIIYGAAYRFIGSEFVNYFAQSILDQPTLPRDIKNELIKVFTEISNQYSKEEESD